MDWTFAGTILGVMSDSGGIREAASTFELGAPGTNYTVTFVGSGPAAPFGARGLEANSLDGYSGVGTQTLRLTMQVSEPGDWIRVITTAEPVPEPSSFVLMALGLLGAGYVARRKRTR